jgi:hypothetical protein
MEFCKFPAVDWQRRDSQIQKLPSHVTTVTWKTIKLLKLAGAIQ